MATVGEKVTDTIVSAIGKAFEAGADKHKDHLGEMIKPMVQNYLASLPEDHPTRQMLASFESSTTVLDLLAWIVGFIPGIVMIIVALAEPYQAEGRRYAWGSAPVRLAPTGALITTARRRPELAVDMISYLKQQGYAEGQRDVMFESSRQLLGLDDVQCASLRGINIGTSAAEYLAKYGLNTDEIFALTQLWQRIPNFDDLVRFAYHNLLQGTNAGQALKAATPPQALVDGAGKLGIDATLATNMWRSHFEHPAVAQALEMWHRGIIKEGDLDELLKVQGIDPDWYAELKTASHPPIPRLVIRQLLHLGLMTEQQAFDAHKALGFDDAAARQMVDYCKAFYGLENSDPTADDRELTKAEVLDGYHKGVIDAGQARTALQGLNYADTTIDFYLAREDLKATQDLKAAYLTRYQALYVNGIKSADETTQDLATLGLGDAEVKQQLALWYLQRISQVQRPTKAELIRWYKAGIINKEIWTAEMRLEGFDDRYISWYDAEIAQTPAEAQQTTEEA